MQTQNHLSMYQLFRKNIIHFILMLLFSVLQGISVIGVSILMKMFLDIATNSSDFSLVVCIFLAVAVLFLLGISQVASSKLQGILSCNMELTIRSLIMTHLYRTDLQSFDSETSDNYFTRMTKDTESIVNFFSKTLISSIFFEILTFSVSLVLMFCLEWKIAIVMVIMVPLLIYSMILLSPILEKYGMQIMAHEDKNRNVLKEFLGQYMLFKSYSMLDWIQERTRSTYSQKKECVGKLNSFQGVIGFLNNFLGVGMFIIALGFGSLFVLRGETTVGTLIAVVNLVSFLYGPFLHISGWLSEYNEMRVSKERINEIFAFPPEENEFDVKTEQELENGLELSAQNLSFGYSKENLLLANTQLNIHKGEIVALTGENGSGKSTLIKLLLGYYIPIKGEVELYIDGKSIRGKKIREFVSFDSGLVSVFEGTLKDNICMNQEYDESRFVQAIELVNLATFLRDNTKEYWIESDGKNLSSGQRRKIALARAFYRDSPVVVLDEPTTNLDQASTEEIFRTLRNVCKDKICLIVTHDSALVAQCDRVIRLDHRVLSENVDSIF